MRINMKIICIRAVYGQGLHVVARTFLYSNHRFVFNLLACKVLNRWYVRDEMSRS